MMKSADRRKAVDRIAEAIQDDKKGASEAATKHAAALALDFLDNVARIAEALEKIADSNVPIGIALEKIAGK